MVTGCAPPGLAGARALRRSSGEGWSLTLHPVTGTEATLSALDCPLANTAPATGGAHWGAVHSPSLRTHYVSDSLDDTVQTKRPIPLDRQEAETQVNPCPRAQRGKGWAELQTSVCLQAQSLYYQSPCHLVTKDPLTQAGEVTTPLRPVTVSWWLL